MMVLPDKEERNMYNIISDWLRTVNDDEPFITRFIDPAAPENVKRVYKDYMDKYLSKDAHWIPLED